MSTLAPVLIIINMTLQCLVMVCVGSAKTKEPSQHSAVKRGLKRLSAGVQPSAIGRQCNAIYRSQRPVICNI